MKIFKNLKFRLLSGLFAFLFVVFYIFGWLFIDSLKQNYTKSIESVLATAIKDLRYEYEDNKFYGDELEDVKKEFDIEILYTQVAKVDKNTVEILEKSKDLKGNNLHFDVEFSNLSEGEILYTTQINRTLTQQKIKSAYLVARKTSDYLIVLQCSIPFKKHNAYIKNMEIALWVGFSTLLGIILWVVYFIISKSLNETKLVLDEVRNIKIDGQQYQIQKTGVATEIDELIDTFNKLIDRLQTSYKNVKEFGQNASHELKTPLTVIKGEVELGLRKVRTQEEYAKILNIVHDEVDTLQDTIEKILFLSTNNMEDIKTRFEDIYVDEIVEEAISEKQSFANSRNVKLNLAEKQAVTITGNHTLLKIAILNLIDNAVKYSHHGGIVNLYLKSDRLIVEDFGIGIEKDEIGKIFDRFYRVDRARSNSSGNGLGLSLVKTILDIHNLDIKVESEIKNKTVFILFFH
ncbi:MAG: HAMP domain-containing sensor histidine kinase [Arcobacteraceae bacterium]|jgi:signal transduction histidine kinase|nr:HAMP domain-containing sensor histidine kinase [Arcobacteraceae bacterium]